MILIPVPHFLVCDPPAYVVPMPFMAQSENTEKINVRILKKSGLMEIAADLFIKRRSVKLEVNCHTRIDDPIRFGFVIIRLDTAIVNDLIAHHSASS